MNPPRTHLRRSSLPRAPVFVRLLATLLSLGTAAMLAACATDPASGDARKLELTLSGYHSAMRWGTIEDTLVMHDPKVLEKQPISTFELERWRQFRVVGYRDSTPTPTTPGHVQQRVVLELINLNTQAVRSVIDVQDWRYDAEGKRWWLVSGLPSLDTP